MNRLISAVLTASALIFGVFLPSEEAAAQTTAKDLVGTWMVAYFGTYSVSETDKTGAIHIESSTFPNWINCGTRQKRWEFVFGCI